MREGGYQYSTGKQCRTYAPKNRNIYSTLLNIAIDSLKLVENVEIPADSSPRRVDITLSVDSTRGGAALSSYASCQVQNRSYQQVDLHLGSP